MPRYVQHTAGDLAFIELALRTGRCVAITYAGRDDFYGTAINHMVFCAHLDGERAAIIDNNRPGFWLWMTREELKTRWLASADRFGRMLSSGGGWAVAFLDPPPPPYPSPVANGDGFQSIAPRDCGCGGDPGCACGPGCTCPRVFGQCSNGRCASPLVLRPSSPGPTDASPTPIGTPPSDRYYWAQFEDGVWGWRLKPEASSSAAADTPTGVVPELIGKHPAYSINGQASTKEEVYSLLQQGSLSDDSGRWHLAAVGDPAFLAQFRADVAKLPIEARDKLHVQAYAPAAWQVAQFKLPAAGVVLRKPAIDRVAAEVGTIAAAEYSSTRLDDLLGDPAGPTPRPAKPGPNSPASPQTPTIPWKLIAAATGLYLLTRKK